MTYTLSDGDILTAATVNRIGNDGLRLLASNATTATISAGAITVDAYTASAVTVSAETGTADDLDTISGGSAGDIILLQAAAGHSISLTTAGNIAAAVSLSETGWLALRYDGSAWAAVGGAGGGTPELVHAGTLLVAGGWMSAADKAAYVSAANSDGTPTPELLDDDTATYPAGGTVETLDVGGRFIFDFGARVALDALRFIQPTSTSYQADTIYIYGSDMGDFAGEEVLAHTETGVYGTSDITMAFAVPAVYRYWMIVGQYVGNANAWNGYEAYFRYQATLMFGGLPWGGKVELLDATDAVLETQEYNNSVYQQALLQCVTDAASVARIKIYYPSDLTTPVIDVTAAELGGLTNGDVWVIE